MHHFKAVGCISREAANGLFYYTVNFAVFTILQKSKQAVTFFYLSAANSLIYENTFKIRKKSGVEVELRSILGGAAPFTKNREIFAMKTSR